MDTLARLAEYLATNLDEWALVAGTVWIGYKAAAVARAQAAAAAQQAALQAESIRLQLWEKRYALYLEIWGLLSAGLRSGAGISIADEARLGNLLPQVRFLFGEAPLEFVEALRASLQESRIHAEKFNAGRPEATTPDALDRNGERIAWQVRQLEELPRVFGSFLAFDSYQLQRAGLTP